MMRLVCCILLTTTLQVQSSPESQDLRSIFQIPNRQKYDELEILERSNFADDSPTTSSATPSLVDTPRSYANAQVMLRFGGEGERRCGCGERCQCRSNPYYVPVLTPLPYCLCVSPHSQNYAPPPIHQTPPITYEEVRILPFPLSTSLSTKKPEDEVEEVRIIPFSVARGLTKKPEGEESKQVDSKPEKSQIVSNTNQQNEQVKNNHPEILGTVTLDDDAIKKPEIIENINEVKCLEEVSNRIEPSELSPNLKIVSLDLTKASKIPKKDLDDYLISYTSPKQKQPKLLVTYPIFNRQKNEGVVKSPVQYRESGFTVSEASGYYKDPGKIVIYKKPTVLSLSDKNVVASPKYICIPVNQVAPVPHTEDCGCCSCTKYAGELNEKSV